MYLFAPVDNDAVKPLAHFQILFIKIEITNGKLKIKVRFNKSNTRRDAGAVCIHRTNASLRMLHQKQYFSTRISPTLKCFKRCVCS